MRSFKVGHLSVFLFIPLMMSLIGTALAEMRFENDAEAYKAMQTSSDTFVITDAIDYLGSSGDNGRRKLLEAFASGAPGLQGAIGSELAKHRTEIIPLLTEVIKNSKESVSKRISACLLTEKILDFRNLPPSYEPLIDRTKKKETASFDEMIGILKSLLKEEGDINLRRRAALTLGSIADAETIIGLRSMIESSPKDDILISLVDLATNIKEQEAKKERDWWGRQAFLNKDIKDVRFELFVYAENEKELKKIMALSEETPKVMIPEAGIRAMEFDGFQADIARRKTCTNIDQSKTTDGKERPGLGIQRNQGPLGWCYAHTAADLIGHKLGKDISAVDLAVNNVLEDNSQPGSTTGVTDKSKEGGWVETVVEIAKKKGVCAEESLESSEEIARTFVRIEKLAEHLSQLETGQDNCLKKHVADLNKVSGSLGLSNAQLIEILKKTSLANLASELITVRCRPRIPFCGWVTEKSSPKTFKEKLELIDKILNRGDIMGIYYYADLLMSERANLEFPHASTIVARRWNDQRGECEYLIRNSWGRDCIDYSPVYDCVDGNIWIPDRTLAKAIYNLTWLEKPEPGAWDSVCRLWQ